MTFPIGNTFRILALLFLIIAATSAADEPKLASISSEQVAMKKKRLFSDEFERSELGKDKNWARIWNAEPAGKQFAPLSLKRSAGSSGCGFSRIFGALRLKPKPLLPLAQLPCPAFLLLVSLMRLIMNPNHALA